ncbi:MAG: hydrogenase nickel incorporation protein HypB [Candidatus Bathyarchaeia archaeon]
MPEPIIAEKGEVFDIELEEDILKKNREIANSNRRLLDEKGIVAIDVMGSIGSGKTAILELLSEALKEKYRIAVIAGDVTTSIDAERIRKRGITSIQVNTGRECHLDANLVAKALRALDLDSLDLIFIENVGNLICPAEFELGAHKRVVVVSVTEGEYMVAKHPFIFMASQVAVINKMDMAKYMGIDPNGLEREAKRINPRITVVRTSAKTGEGIEELISALGLKR